MEVSTAQQTARPPSASQNLANACAVCSKTVYPLERVAVDERVYHKGCMRCAHCNKVLSPGNYSANLGKLYCKPHLLQLFKLTGNYNTGFGSEPHKNKWIRGEVGEQSRDSITNPSSTTAAGPSSTRISPKLPRSGFSGNGDDPQQAQPQQQKRAATAKDSIASSARPASNYRANSTTASSSTTPSSAAASSTTTTTTTTTPAATGAGLSLRQRLANYEQNASNAASHEPSIRSSATSLRSTGSLTSRSNEYLAAAGGAGSGDAKGENKRGDAVENSQSSTAGRREGGGVSSLVAARRESFEKGPAERRSSASSNNSGTGSLQSSARRSENPTRGSVASLVRIDENDAAQRTQGNDTSSQRKNADQDDESNQDAKGADKHTNQATEKLAAEEPRERAASFGATPSSLKEKTKACVAASAIGSNRKRSQTKKSVEIVDSKDVDDPYKHTYDDRTVEVYQKSLELSPPLARSRHVSQEVVNETRYNSFVRKTHSQDMSHAATELTETGLVEEDELTYLRDSVRRYKQEIASLREQLGEQNQKIEQQARRIEELEKK